MTLSIRTLSQLLLAAATLAAPLPAIAQGASSGARPVMIALLDQPAANGIRASIVRYPEANRHDLIVISPTQDDHLSIGGALRALWHLRRTKPVVTKMEMIGLSATLPPGRLADSSRVQLQRLLESPQRGERRQLEMFGSARVVMLPAALWAQ